MNSNLTRAELKTFSNPTQTLLSGDGNDGTETTNARYNLSALPAKWLNDANAPSQRHLGTANYLFADGHVKALKFGQIAPGSPRKHAYTFAPN